MSSQNLEKAQELLQKQNFQEALLIYERVIADEPSSILAYHNAAICLFNMKRFNDAIEMSSKALAMNPDMATAHALLSAIYNEIQEIEKSREEAEIAYNLDPNSAEVLATYGTRLLRDNQIDKAIVILEKASQINPKNYGIHVNLSQAYLIKGDPKMHYHHNKETYHLRPSFFTWLRFIYSYINAYRPMLSFGFLITVFIAFATQLYGILVLPGLYIAFLICGSILLSLTKKR